MEISHTITVLEVVWTVIPLLGLSAAYQLTRRAYSRRQLILNSGVPEVGSMEILARIKLVAYSTFCLILLGNVLIGCVAMLQENVSRTVTPTQAAIATVFVLGTVVIVTVMHFLNVMEQTVRRNIRNEMRDAENGNDGYETRKARGQVRREDDAAGELP